MLKSSFCSKKEGKKERPQLHYTLYRHNSVTWLLKVYLILGFINRTIMLKPKEVIAQLSLIPLLE